MEVATELYVFIQFSSFPLLLTANFVFAFLPSCYISFFSSQITFSFVFFGFYSNN